MLYVGIPYKELDDAKVKQQSIIFFTKQVSCIIEEASSSNDGQINK